MKWELAYRKSKDGLKDYIVLCLFGTDDGGAVLWNQDWSTHPHTTDGFIDRNLVVSYETWNKLHCDCYLQNEKEILEEARKLLVKEML